MVQSHKGLDLLNITYILRFNIKPQSHFHDFGPRRATVHPDLSNCGALA